MSYVTRIKAIIRDVRRHDAPTTSNASLIEFGQAALYHPTSTPLWDAILNSRGWIINPENLSVLDDVGTFDAPDFTPASSGDINAAIASLIIWRLRREMKNWLRAYRLITDSPTVLGPLADSRAEVLATADADATVIVGDNADDPEN